MLNPAKLILTTKVQVLLHKRYLWDLYLWKSRPLVSCSKCGKEGGNISRVPVFKRTSLLSCLLPSHIFPLGQAGPFNCPSCHDLSPLFLPSNPLLFVPWHCGQDKKRAWIPSLLVHHLRLVPEDLCNLLSNIDSWFYLVRNPTFHPAGPGRGQ